MPHSHRDEIVIKRFDDHWTRFVRSALGYLLVLSVLGALGALIMAGDLMDTPLLLITMGTALLVATHAYFVFLFGEALEVTYITQYRLVHFEQTLFTQNDVIEVSFDTTKNVIGTKRGILQNLLDYGNLTFTTTGTTIDYVPKPDRVAELIQELTSRISNHLPQP